MQRSPVLLGRGRLYWEFEKVRFALEAEEVEEDASVVRQEGATGTTSNRTGSGTGRRCWE